MKLITNESKILSSFLSLKNLEIDGKNIKRLKYQTGVKKNLFNIDNYSKIATSIGFDISGLEIGKTYTISCNQSNFRWIKISNSPDGHNSVATHTIPYNESSFTFVMSRNSNIPETATQYIFLQMMNSTSSGFAKSISELGVNQIQIEEGSSATYYVDYNGCVDLGVIPSGGGYILDKYNNLSEELLEENIEKDNINYHIPDKTNILLNKIEGKTNKIVQLIDKTVFVTSGTKVGLTFTCDRNTGAVTVNGTSTASSFWNPSSGLPLINNHKYLVCGNYVGSGLNLGLLNQSSGGYDSGNGGIVTAVTSAESLRNTWGITWDSGTTFSNVTIYPQIFDLTAMYGFGKEPTTVEQFKKDYPQFFDSKLDGIWNVRTSGISSTGKNLFDIDSVSFFTKVSNGEYKSNTYIGIYPDYVLWTPVDGTKQITISGYVKCPVDKNYRFAVLYEDGTEASSYMSSTGDYLYNSYTSDTSKKIKYVYLHYTSGSNEVYIKDVQIEEGSAATTYEPYQENKIDLLSTQTLNGINGVNDYIEVIDKGNGLYDLKKTQNIVRVDMGSLGFDVDGNNFYTGAISIYIKPPVNDNSVGNYSCQKYVNCALNKSFIDGDFGVNSSGLVYFRNSAYTKANEFQTAMSGTLLYYQLKTPVVTTIATNLTYNQVSAIRTNGGLLLVNDNNNQKYVQPDVTLKANYQYKN